MRLMKINRDVWGRGGGGRFGSRWDTEEGGVRGWGGVVGVGDSGLNSFVVVFLTSKFHSRCYRGDRLSSPR